LELTGNYTRNIKPQVFFLPATFFDPNGDSNQFQSVKASANNAYQTGLNLNLPLLQFENRYTLANAKLNQKNADLNVKNLMLKKTAEARKVYFDALWEKSKEDFWIENVKKQNQILAEMRQRFKLGLLMETDTLQIFVQAENLKLNILKAKNAYKIAENQLKLLLDIKSEETLILTDNLIDNLNTNFILSENESVFINEIKSENRPDLQQLTLQTTFLKNQQKIEKAKNMPNVQVVGQYAWLTQDETYNFNKYNWVNTNFVGLQLNLPIFSGFRNKNRIFQTQIQQEQAEETYRFALKQTNLELKTLTNNQQEIIFLLKTQKLTLKASNRLYELVYDRFKQGLVKQSDLQDAEFVQREAKFNELSLIYQYLLLQNEIKRIQGIF
jgi:outer membrane protein TolC